MRPKPGRIDKLKTLLQQVLDSDDLPSGLAASLRGKLQFTLASAFGRCGRAPLQAFVDRQYCRSDERKLTPSLRCALQFFTHLLPKLPDKRISARKTSAPPVLVWSDASFENGHGQLGWVVFDPASGNYWHSSHAVAKHTFDLFVPDKKQYIGQLELLAATVPYHSLPDCIFRNRLVMHFVDNQQALSAVVSGYARQPDNARLVNQLCLRTAHLQCNVYYEWVASKANIADLPSRNDFVLLTKMGSTEVTTVLPDFHSW